MPPADPTKYTEELLGFRVVVDGEEQHAKYLGASPELALDFNEATRQATVRASTTAGRPRQLQNVRYCVTGNLPTSGAGLSWSITGINVGDRVLVPYQTTASQCGVYYYASAGLLLRASDIINGVGHSVFVEEGEPFAGKLFVLRAANTWRAIGGPNYYARAYLLNGGTGGWQALSSLPMVADAVVVNDISVLFRRYRAHDLVVTERRSATYRRNIYDWEVVGPPLTFGEPGDTDIMAHARSSIADGALLIEAYYEPAGGSAWSYTLEADVVQRRVY